MLQAPVLKVHEKTVHFSNAKSDSLCVLPRAQYRLSADLRLFPDVWARGRGAVGPCSILRGLGAVGPCSIILGRGAVGPCSTLGRLGACTALGGGARKSSILDIGMCRGSRGGTSVLSGTMLARGIALAGRGAPGMLPKPMGPARRAAATLCCTPADHSESRDKSCAPVSCGTSAG